MQFKRVSSLRDSNQPETDPENTSNGMAMNLFMHRFLNLFINLITPNLDIIRRIYPYPDLVVFVIEDSDFYIALPYSF